MLEYVYIETKKGLVKIMCQDTNGTLPDFSTMGITQAEYEERLEEYQDYLQAKQAYETNVLKYEELFYGNIDLFMEHFDEIVNEPKFANIMLPQVFYSTRYVTLSDRGITLGEQLNIYKNEQYYTTTCPKCGDKLYLISFSFSPFSGNISAKHRCFGSCKKTFRTNEEVKICVGCNGIQLSNIRKKYSPMKSDVAPVHIAELLKHLGKDVECIDGFYEDDSIDKSKSTKSKRMIALCHTYNHGVFDEQKLEKIEQIKSNIIVPQQAWTLGFVGQILSQNALYFGELPDKFKRDKTFLKDMIDNTDWIPELGMISPKLLTAEACIRAINAYPHRRKGLLKFVPEHLFQEVETATRMPFGNEMIGIISAYRYFLTDELNEKRHKMLLNELQALGFGHRSSVTIWEDKNKDKHIDKNILVTIRYGEKVGCKITFEEFSKIMNELSICDYGVLDEQFDKKQYRQEAFIVKDAGESASLFYTFHDTPTRKLGDMSVDELTQKLVKIKLTLATKSTASCFYKIVESTKFSKNDETNCSAPLRGTTETIRRLRKNFISH